MTNIDRHTAPCPYFEGKEACFEYLILEQFGHAELDSMLRKGFRHFGTYFFRPVCSGCKLCIPYRINVRNFSYRKWQKRIMRNGPVPSYGKPSIRKAFSLYSLHKNKFATNDPVSIEEFFVSFFYPYEGNEYLVFRDGDNLECVCHFDHTPNAYSAVYSYYDYNAGFSFGSLAIITLIQKAIENDIPYLYLGYYIPDHPHMSYKARFYPAEIMNGDGFWISMHRDDIVPV